MSDEHNMKPKPTDIRLHQASRVLEIKFDDGKEFSLTCEYLRVYSPSAEVRGHGVGQEVLQTNKELVNITAIEAVGQYGIKLIFDDGHDTGIYSWPVLYRLGCEYETLWPEYLQKLDEAGYQRQVENG